MDLDPQRPVVAQGQVWEKKTKHPVTSQKVLRALFATPGAVRMVECDAQMASRLPGFGLEWDEIPAVA